MVRYKDNFSLSEKAALALKKIQKLNNKSKTAFKSINMTRTAMSKIKAFFKNVGLSPEEIAILSSLSLPVKTKTKKSFELINKKPVFKTKLIKTLKSDEQHKKNKLELTFSKGALCNESLFSNKFERSMPKLKPLSINKFIKIKYQLMSKSLHSKIVTVKRQGIQFLKPKEKIFETANQNQKTKMLMNNLQNIKKNSAPYSRNNSDIQLNKAFCDKNRVFEFQLNPQIMSSTNSFGQHFISDSTNRLDDLIEKSRCFKFLMKDLKSYAAKKNLAASISKNITTTNNSMKTTNNNQTYNYGNTFNLSNSYKSENELESLIKGYMNMALPQVI